MMLSVILLSMLKILLSILSVIGQQLELAFEIKSHLLGTIDLGKKQIVDFDSGKFIRLTGLMIVVLLM